MLSTGNLAFSDHRQQKAGFLPNHMAADLIEFGFLPPKVGKNAQVTVPSLLRDFPQCRLVCFLPWIDMSFGDSNLGRKSLANQQHSAAMNDYSPCGGVSIDGKLRHKLSSRLAIGGGN
jgi:hypothetical protein